MFQQVPHELDECEMMYYCNYKRNFLKHADLLDEINRYRDCDYGSLHHKTFSLISKNHQNLNWKTGTTE